MVIYSMETKEPTLTYLFIAFYTWLFLHLVVLLILTIIIDSWDNLLSLFLVYFPSLVPYIQQKQYIFYLTYDDAYCSYVTLNTKDADSNFTPQLYIFLPKLSSRGRELIS